MAKVYDNASDLITFARSSSGTALRRVGYGDELVDNNDFVAGATGWSTSASWTIGSGVATSSGGTGEIIQTGKLTIGKVYSLTYDATISGGYATIFGTNLTIKAGSGVTTSFKCSASTNLGFYGFGFTGTIDNISVKEVIFDRATDDLVLFNHPNDIPRIEYAADGSLKGLLIEEQRTNLVTYSEDNSQWYTNASASLSDGTDGFTLGTTAAVSSSRFATPNNTITMTAGQILTGSWEIDTSQTDDLSNVDIYLGRQGSTRLKREITVSGNTITLAAPSGGTTTFGNLSQPDPVQTGPTTWRISIVAENVSGADQNVVCGFWDNKATLSRTIAVRNPQLEEGSFPTSYIPTSGGQKTRDPDLASIPVSAFGYNQQAGTVVVEAQTNTPESSLPYLWQLDANISDTRIACTFRASGGAMRMFVQNSGSTDASLYQGSPLTETTEVTTAGAWKTDDVAFSYDGSTTANDTDGCAIPLANTLRLGGRNVAGTTALNGHIKSIQYFPRRLTDAQLQELTA